MTRRCSLGATNVRTGKVRVFKGQEVTPEALMASACLPTVFQAVEIGGEAYWDGGYTGNPSLWPLYDRALPDDIVIVQVNPLRREGCRRPPLDIQNRVNEISFNASLLSELRAIGLRQAADRGRQGRGRADEGRPHHMIADDVLMNDLSAGSKMEPSDALIDRLHEAGRAAARAFHRHLRRAGGTGPDGRSFGASDLAGVLGAADRQGRRHDKLGRVIHAHVEDHQILRRHEQQHPAGERRQPHERPRHLWAIGGQPFGQFALGAGGQKAKRP